jgi:hypothetical protein
MKIVGIVLIAAGLLAVAFRGFAYKKETHDAHVGPVGISVTEKERIDVPVWAGVAMIVVGAGLLVAAKKN